MAKRCTWAFFLAVGILLLFGARSASANEGTTILSGDKTNGRCFATSVLVDAGDYRILMTCENLTLPPTSEKLFYHVWAKKTPAVDSKSAGKLLGRSNYLSFGDLGNGKLLTRAREAFTDIFITSEKESDPSSPNLDALVVSGTIQPIDFGSGRTQVIAQPTSSIASVTIGASPRPTVSLTAGKSVVGTAFRVFLTILGIIVAVAIVISLIQRQSASK